jgi:hypothetical protein
MLFDLFFELTEGLSELFHVCLPLCFFNHFEQPMVAITHADCFLQWANSKITFQGHFAAKKLVKYGLWTLEKVWIMG